GSALLAAQKPPNPLHIPWIILIEVDRERQVPAERNRVGVLPRVHENPNRARPKDLLSKRRGPKPILERRSPEVRLRKPAPVRTRDLAHRLHAAERLQAGRARLLNLVGAPLVGIRNPRR